MRLEFIGEKLTQPKRPTIVFVSVNTYSSLQLMRQPSLPSLPHQPYSFHRQRP